MNNKQVYEANMHDQDSLYAFDDWFLDEALKNIRINGECDCIPVRITVEFLNRPFDETVTDDDEDEE